MPGFRNNHRVVTLWDGVLLRVAHRWIVFSHYLQYCCAFDLFRALVYIWMSSASEPLTPKKNLSARNPLWETKRKVNSIVSSLKCYYHVIKLYVICFSKARKQWTMVWIFPFKYPDPALNFKNPKYDWKKKYFFRNYRSWLATLVLNFKFWMSSKVTN